MTLVSLARAGLLGRSLLRVLSVDPGFRTANIVSMELEVPQPPVETNFYAARCRPCYRQRPARFMETLIGRLRALPGIEESAASPICLRGRGRLRRGQVSAARSPAAVQSSQPEDVARLERLWPTAPGGEADYCVASEGYFRALGIPLLRGRLFNERDTVDTPHVAVISQSLARATWPHQDPLGHTIEFGNMDGDLRLLTVVGVVGEVHQRSLENPPEPTVYVDYRQRLRGGRDFTVVMRAATPPTVLLADARRIVHDLAPDVAPRFQAFQEVFSASLDTRRFNLTLVGVFAASALLLAAVGIFGVVAYWVSQRTSEIGIRMALGAQKIDVLWLVVGQGIKLAVIGVGIGITGALGLTRFLVSLLYDVRPTDPLTFVGVSLLLTSVALLACYVPARRAMKVDPMVALRYE